MSVVCTSALVAAAQEAPLSHQCKLSGAGKTQRYLHCCRSHLFAAVSFLLVTFKVIQIN